MIAIPKRVKSRQASAEGFTLIELVVVIAVIVMVAALSLPALAKFLEDRKLKAAGTLVMTTLNEARTNAVTQKTSIGVIFYQRGMRLYDFEGTTLEGGDVVHFLGGLRAYQSVVGVQYRLQFAELAYDEIPKQPEDILDEALRTEDVFLKFQPDGTISFGRHSDVPTANFAQQYPANADIIIDYFQGGGGFEYPEKAWIDVRPQGRMAYKIAESKAEEE